MNKLAVFDCDGTLVDSGGNIHSALSHAFAEHGFDVPAPEVSRRVAESGTGVLLKRKDLSAMRLKSAVREARGLRLDRQLSGGSAAFADAASEMVTAAGLELEAHGDRSLIR